jgi:hypothetical protein
MILPISVFQEAKVAGMTYECPAYSDYFWDRISIFAIASLDHDPPIYASCSNWDDSHTPPCSAFLSRWGLMNFLPRLALNCDPPDFCLLSNYGYRREPPRWPFRQALYHWATFPAQGFLL